MNKLMIALLLSTSAVVAETKMVEAKAEVAAHHKDATHNKDVVIKEILDMTMFTKEFEKVMNDALSQLAEQLQAKEKTAHIQKEFMKEFKAAVTPKLTKLYADNFDDKELKRIKDWQSTPEAKKLIKISQEVSNATMQASQEAMIKVVTEVQKEMAAKKEKEEKNKPVGAHPMAAKAA